MDLPENREPVANRQSNLAEALDAFRQIITEAEERRLPEPTSVSLATADINGQPSVRTVYLISIHEQGPVFFINTESGKGKQLAANPLVALCMHVPELQQQVTLEGEIKGFTDEESDSFWRNRTRDSQLASWASDQATTVESRTALTEKRDQFKAEFSFESVPRPEKWKALSISPTRIEFWDTGWHRLRQRRLYTKQAEGEWRLEIENP